MVGIVPSRFEWIVNKYNLSLKYPFFFSASFNARVLMDLSCLRQIGWLCIVEHIYYEFGHLLAYADQDLLNIFAYCFPSTFYKMPCSFNYRTDQFKFTNMNCADVENNGVAILYGIRGEFHKNYEPIFKQ